MTRWQGDDEVRRNMRQYAADVKAATRRLAERWAVEIENHAKDNAVWVDQTANARQSLYTVVDDGEDGVTIYLSHGVSYGVYLELANQGQYAIILRSLEHYYNQVAESYRRMLD